jgi:hypothetical protein
VRVVRIAVLAALALVASLPVAAQQGAPPPQSAPAPQAEDPGAQIDEILAGEEAVLAGGTYSYDPGNRRDPFKSLIVGRNQQAPRGPMPEGIAGLLIDEIDLTGIFKTSRGYVAQVVAANRNKSYLLRDGDQLYDGDVVSVSQGEVVFKQIVNDPTVIKPFREVVKKLSP